MTRFGQGKPAGNVAAGGAPKGNLFSGLDPNAGGSRNPPLPFDTTCVVEVISTERKQVTSDVVVTEIKVLESDSEAVTIGGTYAIIQAVGDKWGYGIANVTKMAFALGNCTPEEQEEFVADARAGHGILNAACGEAEGIAKHGENPLAGYRMRVYTTRGKEDDKGGHYRNHQFSAIE